MRVQDFRGNEYIGSSSGKKVAFRDSYIFQRSLFVKNSTTFVLRTKRS